MAHRKVTALIQTLLALIGAADAGTIYLVHRAGADLPCTTGDGCDLVNASHWAFIFGIPVALIGAAGYIALLFASVLRLTTDSDALASRVNAGMLVISLAGTCYSWYLQYVAHVYIGAFCIWCRVSAITMTLIFVASLVAMFLARRGSVTPSAAAAVADRTSA